MPPHIQLNFTGLARYFPYIVQVIYILNQYLNMNALVLI